MLGAGLWILATLIGLWLVTEGNWLDLVALACGGAGLYLLWTCGRGLLTGRRIPAVGLSSSDLAVGEAFAVQWEPDALDGRADVTAWLVCREVANRRPDARSAADVHEWVVGEASQDAFAGRTGELRLAVPEDAMHSFRARHSALEWLVEVELRPRRGSVARANLPLTVQPRLHGEANDGGYPHRHPERSDGEGSSP